MLTLNKVNKALAAIGAKELLVKGQGYFYFVEGETATWKSTMVCVSSLQQLTLEQWLDEHKALKDSSTT